MLDKMTKYLIKPIRVFVFLIVLLMCVLIIIQIFCRFVLNWSVPWTEEMARLCFLWMIFLGSAIVECDGGQVTTELLVKKMKTSSRLVLQTVIYLLEIVFNACLFIGAITSWNTVKMMTFATVPALNYTLMYIPVLIGMPIMIFYLLVQMLSFIKNRNGIEREA